MILVGVILIGMIQVIIDVILTNVIQNYRFFTPKILTLSSFENAIAFRVFNFTFRCAMSRCALV